MEPEVLLEKLINFKTVNDPVNDIRPDPTILEYIQKRVQEWNPDIESQILEDTGYYSLYLAVNPRQVDILFMGHLDVVPVGQGWTSDPFSLRIESSGLGYGRGAKDCKGSVVSALIMLEKLCREKNRLQKKIGIFLSTDEESGGRFGAGIFFDRAKKHSFLPRFVINVDGGPRVVHKRRAGFGVRINLPPKVVSASGEIKVQKCHTSIIGDENRHSAYFVRGSDTHAVVALSKLLHLHQDWGVVNLEGSWIKGNVIPDGVEAEIVLLSKEQKTKSVYYDENLTNILRKIRSLILINPPTEIYSEFGVTVNPNLISYSITEGTEVYFDVRAFLSSEKTSLLIEAFNEQLEELASIARISSPGTSGYFNTPTDNLLVKTANKTLENHLMSSKSCEQEGASDARYASEQNIPVIDLGPRGGNIHGTDEFIDLNSMKEFASIYKEIVSRLLTT